MPASKYRDISGLILQIVELSTTVGSGSTSTEGTGVEAVILPLALFWAQENVERAKQTWPAAMMVERFVEIVKVMASKNSTAVITQT